MNVSLERLPRTALTSPSRRRSLHVHGQRPNIPVGSDPESLVEPIRQIPDPWYDDDPSLPILFPLARSFLIADLCWGYLESACL